jgi:hypothetical protein
LRERRVQIAKRCRARLIELQHSVPGSVTTAL